MQYKMISLWGLVKASTLRDSTIGKSGIRPKTYSGVWTQEWEGFECTFPRGLLKGIIEQEFRTL